MLLGPKITALDFACNSSVNSYAKKWFFRL